MSDFINASKERFKTFLKDVGFENCEDVFVKPQNRYNAVLMQSQLMPYNATAKLVEARVLSFADYHTYTVMGFAKGDWQRCLCVCGLFYENGREGECTEGVDSKKAQLIAKINALASNSGASESEALQATRMAQKLMAKYHIEVSEEEGTGKSGQMVYAVATIKQNKSWYRPLQTIVAKNYCCKPYYCTLADHTEYMFVGNDVDALTARRMFCYLQKTGDKLATRAYAEYKRAGMSTKYVYNTFVIGFYSGVKSALEKGSAELALIVPEAEIDKFVEGTVGEGKKQRVTTFLGRDNRLYAEGFAEGKNAVSGRRIDVKYKQLEVR